MTKKIRFTVMLLSFFILTSCTGPSDRLYDPLSYQNDLRDIARNGEMDSLQLLSLELYISKNADREKELEGLTYSQIGKAAEIYRRKTEVEERRKKEAASRAEKEQQQLLEKLRRSIEIRITEKAYEKEDWQEFLTYALIIENRSRKDIRAFKGIIVFTDLFDEEIHRFEFTYDQGIIRGEKKRWKLRRPFNSFESKEVTLRQKELKDLKVIWIPEKIIFEDNTSL